MSTPKKPKLISGGHKGAEAEFGRAAKRHGIAQTTLSFKGHAMEWPVNVRVMNAAELAEGDVSMQIVSNHMGRTYHEAALIRRVFQSLFHMVNGAWQVFAVGWIQPDNTVKGGTGWGVELAKLFNRETWVFDQEKSAWFRWSDGHWVPGAPKIEARPFAGTGTRNLTESGQRAIEALFTDSFGPAKR